MRDPADLVGDMLDACRQILSYVGRGGDRWMEDPLFVDAVVRNLEILGEAAKNVPPGLREGHPLVPWRDISRLRDVLAHRYFGVDVETIRDIVANEIVPLRDALAAMVGEVRSHE